MKKVLLFAVMLIGLTFASCEKEVIETHTVIENYPNELTFLGEHDLENQTSWVVSEFKNDLGAYTYVQGGLGNHVVEIPSLIGKSVLDIDISIETISSPSGNYTAISPENISFSTSNGVVSFWLVADGGISITSMFRFQLRVK